MTTLRTYTDHLQIAKALIQRDEGVTRSYFYPRPQHFRQFLQYINSHRMKTTRFDMKPQAVTLSIVNQNRIAIKDIVRAMGLGICNVRCIRTNIGEGKYLSKS